MTLRTGLIERKAVAIDSRRQLVIVQEVWDWTAHDSPFCPWPRGSALMNPCPRQITMFRAEAEKLGLLPRTN